MRKLYLLLFVLILPLAVHSAGPSSFPVSCAPELRRIWQLVQKLPEAREVIQAVLREGPLTLDVNRSLSTKFGAFWTGDARAILVNPPHPGDDCGETIGSIIFELHNALADRELTQLDQQAAAGQLSKHRYVEAVEHIEYRNAVKASKIARLGITRGLFPETAHLPVYSSFEEHFRIQREAGHSAWIGRTYEQLRAQ
jgi:hypothetical protein